MCVHGVFSVCGSCEQRPVLMFLLTMRCCFFDGQYIMNKKIAPYITYAFSCASPSESTRVTEK